MYVKPVFQLKRTPFFKQVAVCIWAVCGLLLPACAQVSLPEIFVPYVDTSAHPITIDGFSDDWPTGSLAYGVNFYSGDGNSGSSIQYGTTALGAMSGRDDGEITLYLAHDGAHLFLLAIICDDFLEQRSSEKNRNEAWKEDALHIYIDSTNAQRAAIPNPPIRNQVGFEQFGVSTDYNCYTENCDFTTNNGARNGALRGAQPDQEYWLVSVHIEGTGPYTYVFEERIPLQEIPGHNLRTMTPGQSYGFNVEFVDSDAGVYLQGWIFWSGDGRRDGWNYENLWGRMILENVPVLPSFVGSWDLYK